jgi:hypothetical protein
LGAMKDDDLLQSVRLIVREEMALAMERFDNHMDLLVDQLNARLDSRSKGVTGTDESK